MIWVQSESAGAGSVYGVLYMFHRHPRKCYTNLVNRTALPQQSGDAFERFVETPIVRFVVCLDAIGQITLAELPQKQRKRLCIGHASVIDGARPTVHTHAGAAIRQAGNDGGGARRQVMSCHPLYGGRTPPHR